MSTSVYRAYLRRCSGMLLLLAGASAYAQHGGHAPPVPQPSAASQQGAPAAQPDGRASSGGGSPASGQDGMSAPVSDDMVFHQVLVDELEYGRSDGEGSLRWDAQAWVGKDFGRLWLRTDGERSGGVTEDGRVELLGSKPVTAFWDLQAGLRHDLGIGPKRNWLAFGVQGLAPYWFDIQATAYLGSHGRLAAQLEAEYQLLLTQRLTLAPKFEADLYSKSDPQRGIGSGLSEAEFSLRLRYEIRRELAPYLGVSWGRKFGRTATLARQSQEDVSERRLVAGVRFWF